ncbi:MAG: hypothetical protein Q8L48_21600 [Archangium sp.]|nr:hypothetical protein [Archangium sp.]
MRTLVFAVLTFSSLALGQANDVSYQFRSVEDPAFPADDTICAQAPFRVNVKLGASLWSQHVRVVDGRIVVDQVLRIGKATACVELTNFLFPPGLQQNFYAVFDLPSGRYTGLGTCTLSSNNVPQAGLVLAGCTLNVVSGPNGVLGGVITSASTFNPARLAGYSTGSLWTLQAYTAQPVPWWPWTGGGQGFQLHDDRRSDDEIDRVRRNGHGH